MALVAQYTEDFEGTLGNWDVYTNGAGTTDLVATNVIVGSKSLRLLSPDSPYQVNLLPTVASGLSPAVTSGALRVLARKVVAAGGITMIGLACQQSARNITTTGTCYVAGYRAVLGALVIYKVTSGGFDGAKTLLASGSFTWTTGTDICLEFEWDTSGGQAVLTLRQGTATDFSDLTDVLTYTDITSPYLTSSGQGLAYASPNFSAAPEYRMDNAAGYAQAPPDVSWISRTGGQVSRRSQGLHTARVDIATWGLGPGWGRLIAGERNRLVRG